MFATVLHGGSVAGITTFVPLASALNQIPAGRLDANAIKLMNLYPLPTTSALFSNYASSPKLYEHSDAFDARMDANFTDKNQLFFRFSYKNDPDYIPALRWRGGRGAFQQGNQTALAQQSAMGYTHTFSPTLINEVRAGLNYLHTTRSGPVSGVSGLPAEYGIQDIPQGSLNAAFLPLASTSVYLGEQQFLASDEVSSTFQLTDDVTKIYGKHTFKMGFEWQHVKFSTLQPSWSHGEFDYNGAFTDIAGGTGSSSTGRADFLLTPTTRPWAARITSVGPVTSEPPIWCNRRRQELLRRLRPRRLEGHFQLTLNLGVRYDFFGLVFEHHNAQANFVPNGPGARRRK